MKDCFDTCTRELPGLPVAGLIAARTKRGGGRRSLRWVEELGYSSARDVGSAGVCAVRRMLFTGALVVGITRERYSGRYCYETEDAALAALAVWDGRGSPPGPWIKYKGDGGERLGPGCLNEHEN